MNRRSLNLLLIVILALAAGGVGGVVGASAGAGVLGQLAPKRSPGLAASPLVAVGSGFTYQGQLVQGGSPADGLYDFIFTLYDDPTGGSQVGSAVSLPSQQVTGGLFNVVLDFGADAFRGEARWLEIAVQVEGGGEYTTLSPRQPLTPAPYAQSAPWTGVSGKPWIYNGGRMATIATNLDSTGTVGQYASVTVGVDGMGLISYYDATNGDLKVAHCDDLACTSATVTTLDSAADAGRFSSITIGADGLGVIVYFEGPVSGAGSLKVAHCADLACTSAAITTYDATTSAGGLYPSVTVGADGLPLLTYKNTGGTLVIAHCSSTDCASGTNTTVAGVVPRWTSITVGSDQFGVVAYKYSSGLGVVHCFNTLCTSTSNNPVDTTTGATGEYPTITINGEGLPLIAYSTNGGGSALKVARCIRFDCAFSTTITTIGRFGNAAAVPASLTIGPDEYGLITYYDPFTGYFKMGRCLDFECSSFNSVIVDGMPSIPTGTYTSITTGADGLPLIGYYDSTKQDLRVRHCGSPFCIPFKKYGR